MISTHEIRTALVAAITGTGLFEAVMSHNVADLSDALETLRDSPDALAVIVPSRDAWTHQMAIEDENLPARAELRNEFEILITSRDLKHGDDGDLDCVALKDQLAAALCWSDLGLTAAICLPLESEPMVIERDHQRGREAWKLTLEIRQPLTTPA